MRKKYEVKVSLPIEATERVREYLTGKGSSLSAFLSTMVELYDEEVRGQKGVLEKPFDEVTVHELLEYVNRWARKMKELNE